MVQYRGSIPRRKANTMPVARREARPAASAPVPVSIFIGDVSVEGQAFWIYAFPAEGAVRNAGLHVGKITGEALVELVVNGESRGRFEVNEGVNEIGPQSVLAGDRVTLIAHPAGDQPAWMGDTCVSFMWCGHARV